MIHDGERSMTLGEPRHGLSYSLYCHTDTKCLGMDVRQWVRAGLIGVGSVGLTLVLHVVLLQLWVGPYPLSSRWWADGFVLMPVVAAVVIGVATADIGEDRAGAWLADREVPQSPEARQYVRRWVSLTRTCRAIGFFGVALLGVVASWSVNTSGVPVGSVIRDHLMDVMGAVGWSAPIAGYAVGALVAEVIRRPPTRGDVPRADLRPRVSAAYMQPLARWGPRVLAAAGLAVAGLSGGQGFQVVAGPSSSDVAIISVVTLVTTEVVRWAIVRQRQRAADPATVALDDASRATTIHAVSGSAIAVIGQAFGDHLWSLSPDLPGPASWVRLAGGIISLVSLGTWLGYGVGLVWVVRRGPRATARPARPHA